MPASYTSEFNASLDIFNNHLYGHHLKVPQEIVKKYSSGIDRRVLIRLNDLTERACAIMPHPEGYFLLINKDVRSKLDIKLGDVVKVEIKKDNSEFGAPLPEEFEIVMEQDLTGREYFLKLTPGKQRSLLHLVSKIKSPDKRIVKALAIMHHLNEVNGNLDFKLLNETIKQFNQDKNLLR